MNVDQKKNNEGTAVVYLRGTHAASERGPGAERQRAECLALCARLGIGPEGVESVWSSPVSAMNGPSDEGLDQLLARVEEGVSQIVVWGLDKMARCPRDLERLLEVAEAHPVRIVMVSGGSLDLSAAKDRLAARLMISLASYDVEFEDATPQVAPVVTSRVRSSGRGERDAR